MTAPDILALLDADAERAGKVGVLAGVATEGPWLVETLRARDAAIRAVLDLCDNWRESVAARPGRVQTPPDLIRAALASALGGGEQQQPEPVCTYTFPLPSWAGEDQMDPCRCNRPAGHDGDHSCSHTDPQESAR